MIVGLNAVSAMRSFMLCDLWVHARNRELPWLPHEPASGSGWGTGHRPIRAGAALRFGVVFLAGKKNGNRHPTKAHPSVLETCQTLDTVGDAETRDPLGDPQFGSRPGGSLFMPFVRVRARLPARPAVRRARVIACVLPAYRVQSQQR